MPKGEKLLVVLLLMAVTWPLFEVLFPYSLHIVRDEQLGWSWWLERKR